MKNKSINLKKMLYISLFTFIVAGLLISSIVVYKNHMEKVNTWQYQATYDFEQVIETDISGKKTAILKIESPYQLVGAMNTLAAISNPGVSIKDGAGSSSSSSGSSKTDDSTISNAVDKLQGFDKESTVIRLTQNIAFDNSKYRWVPADFSGQFDGMGYIISGLNISSDKTNVGFVGNNTGTIINVAFENVTVKCSKTAGNAHNTGVVAGTNSGTIKNVTITSGSVTGNLNSSGKTNENREIGGIAGKNSGTIEYCINRVPIKYGKHIGGIVGISTSGSVKYCQNYGEIANTETIKTQYSRVGGIAGEISGGSITTCQNYGYVTGDSSNDSGNCTVGGIIGCSAVAINQCANFGVIKSGTSNTKISYAGGIVGQTAKNITDCFNLANISAYAKVSTASKAITKEADKSEILYEDDSTLILGLYNRWVEETLLYSNNDKDIKNSKVGIQESVTKAYAGGIAGRCDGTAKNCYSVGTIIGGKSTYTLTVPFSFSLGTYTKTSWVDLAGGGMSVDTSAIIYVFFVGLQFTYQYLSDPIVAVNSNDDYGRNYSNTYADTEKQQETKYKYKADWFEYRISQGVDGKMPWWSPLYNFSTYSTNSVALSGEKFSNGNYEIVSSLYDSIIKNIKVGFETGISTVKVKTTFTADGKSKTYDLKSYNVNQAKPSSSAMTVKSVANMKNSDFATKLGANWDFDTDKNNSYPYIKNMYW